MNILGIETSCDETAASIVRDGRCILSNVISSSLKEHQKFGGIIPEIASRRQLEYIYPVVETALEKAKLSLPDIDAIAVTHSPGLIGSLLVGGSFAKALSYTLDKPLIKIDHIKAHLYANFLRDSQDTNSHNIPNLPAIGLVVSGGHSSLYDVKDHGHYVLLGETLDDAAGEAFDKVARILDIGYPGGPAIDQIAQQATDLSLRFTCAKLPGTFNFSFSGVKTGVLYYKQKHEHEDSYSVANVAHGFQESVVRVLVDKSMDACRKKKINTLVVGGGVAANSCLRHHLKQASDKYNIDVHYPPMILCTDNAAMIAGYGYQIFKRSKSYV